MTKKDLRDNKKLFEFMRDREGDDFPIKLTDDDHFILIVPEFDDEGMVLQSVTMVGMISPLNVIMLAEATKQEFMSQFAVEETKRDEPEGTLLH
jgi:hypothetical protein